MINKFRGEYGFLSNFSTAVITMDDGITYPTTEHAFQAYKTLDLEERKRIAALATPTESKAAGRTIKGFRKDWSKVSISVMEQCLRKKFALPHLRAKLLATGDQELIEGNTWGDKFWGVCDGEGQNNLGKLLMKIRQEIKNEHNRES